MLDAKGSFQDPLHEMKDVEHDEDAVVVHLLLDGGARGAAIIEGPVLDGVKLELVVALLYARNGLCHVVGALAMEEILAHHLCTFVCVCVCVCVCM